MKNNRFRVYTNGKEITNLKEVQLDYKPNDNKSNFAKELELGKSFSVIGRFTFAVTNCAKSFQKMAYAFGVRHKRNNKKHRKYRPNQAYKDSYLQFKKH